MYHTIRMKFVARCVKSILLRLRVETIELLPVPVFNAPRGVRMRRISVGAELRWLHRVPLAGGH
jgi:hypothetical protein